MEIALWVGLFIPLAGFLILAGTSGIIGRKLTGYIGSGTIFIAFLCFVTILLLYTTEGLSPQNFKLFTWIPVEQINADFTLRIDPLSVVMTLIITGVGFLIHVYSIGYMEHDEDYARFFACMNFFVFAMLLLVLAANLLLLFVGWEGVGLASYLLIGYYYTRPAAAQAATKAFVVNRIGDWGFLVGLLLTFYLFGTSDIAEISAKAGQQYEIGAGILVVLTLLWFIGCTGKSAQIPLHIWLPDAMEGPTPVSALIHAATMVTAGVYLVVRMHPIFMLAPATLQLIGVVGAVTALFASLCALAQTDIKRVLAYSTVSQLGYMFLACGAGAFYAAMFHLMTHAFMKALLFLSAGNVIHMMNGATEMDKMGGLWKKFPKTHWLFLVGVLAMSGVPPLAAFFSKDLILEQDYLAGYETLFYIGLVTAIITAFYLTRAYCLAFLGEHRLEDKIIKVAKEAPNVMVIPVAILAVLSILGGFIGFCFSCGTPVLEGFLEKVGVGLSEKAEFSIQFLYHPETLMSIAGALLGIAAAAIVYTGFPEKLGNPIAFLRRSFYIDEIYWYLIAVPLRSMAWTVAQVIEPKLFDSSIRAVNQATQGVAHTLQLFQSGQIRSYVAWMVLGTVFFIAYFVF